MFHAVMWEFVFLEKLLLPLDNFIQSCYTKVSRWGGHPYKKTVRQNQMMVTKGEKPMQKNVMVQDAAGQIIGST